MRRVYARTLRSGSGGAFHEPGRATTTPSGHKLRGKGKSLAEAQSSQRKVRIFRACLLGDWRNLSKPSSSTSARRLNLVPHLAFDFDFPLRLRALARVIAFSRSPSPPAHPPT